MKDKTILIIGCGGLGGFVCEYLARLKVGSLILVDGDTFCESNIDRQLESGYDTLGKNKALVYKERLEKKHCLSVTAVGGFLTEQNESIVANADLVMDCVDTVKTRLFIEKVCEKYGKPFVHGGLEGSCGQACVCYPGAKVLQRLYAASEEVRHSTNVFTVASVAALQVSLAKKVLDGKKQEVENKLFLIDMENYEIDVMSI